MKNSKQSIHGTDEVRLLKLLKQVQKILADALNSLSGKSPPTPESNYLSQSSVLVNKAADGYLHLRKSGRVYASKLLVRPALEATFSGIAAIKKPGFLFRKAYTEWKKDKKLYVNDASANHVLEKLIRSAEKANPSSPIEHTEISVYETAEAAGLVKNYNAYRVYCQFTHGAIRVMLGKLDEQTNKIDTKIVAWCVLTVLDHLKENTSAQIPVLTPFKKSCSRNFVDIYDASSAFCAYVRTKFPLHDSDNITCRVVLEGRADSRFFFQFSHFATLAS